MRSCVPTGNEKCLCSQKKRVCRRSINAWICSLWYTEQKFYLQFLIEVIVRIPPTCFFFSFFGDNFEFSQNWKLSRKKVAQERFHEFLGSMQGKDLWAPSSSFENTMPISSGPLWALASPPLHYLVNCRDHCIVNSNLLFTELLVLCHLTE